MAVATDISQTLSKIQPAAAAIAKSAEEQKGKIQALVNDMSKAIRDNNRPLIERHLQTLEKLKLPPYAQLLTATNNLLGQLKELEPEDGSEELKKVNALTESLGALQAKLEGNFDKLKYLEDLANKALAQSAQDGKDATDEWAAMEAELNKQLQVAKTRLEAMRALEDLANAAVKDGDPADLDAAIKRSAARATWKPTAKEVVANFSTFCKKCESKGLSKELQDQLARDRAKYQKIVDQIVELNELMDNSVKRIQAREIPKAKPQPIDFKELKHVLGLDKYPKIEDDLKGALKLEGSARAKALDAIEKKFNFKFKSDHRAKLMEAKKQ